MKLYGNWGLGSLLKRVRRRRFALAGSCAGAQDVWVRIGAQRVETQKRIQDDDSGAGPAGPAGSGGYICHCDKWVSQTSRFNVCFSLKRISCATGEFSEKIQKKIQINVTLSYIIQTPKHKWMGFFSPESNLLEKLFPSKTTWTFLCDFTERIWNRKIGQEKNH